MDAWVIHCVYGLVQGIAEWLPISSSGHLALLDHLFNLKQNVAYDVFLHVASLLVLLVYFRKDLIKLSKALFDPTAHQDRRIIGQIVLTTFVTIIVVLLTKSWGDSLDTLFWLAIFFGVNAGVLIATRYVRQGSGTITWQIAGMLGVVQAFAGVIPSLSRSGITIALAMILGVDRAEAFRFSFLMAIPAIAAAMAYEAKDLIGSSWDPLFLIGFGTTIIFGYVSLGLLQKIISRDKLYVFWIYNVAIALIIIGYLVYA